MSEIELKIAPIRSERELQANPAADSFRVELRHRLERMTDVARQNGASTFYLERLRSSSEKILAAVEPNIDRGRETHG